MNSSTSFDSRCSEPMRGLPCRLAIVLTLSMLASLQQVQAASLRTVALSDRVAPGAPDGVNYGAGFSPPAINASGKTAFLGALTGSGVDNSNNQAIWAERGGATVLVARLGSAAPGTGGATFTGLGEPLFNDAGQTAFFGFDGRQAIWSEGSGALARVVRSGENAAGTPSGFIFIYRYGQFDSLAFNNAGKTAFAASIDSPTGPISFGLDDKAAWTDRDGAVQMYVRGGWQAAGAPSGVQYVYTRGTLGYGEEFKPALNNSGRLAFQTRLRGTGVTTANNRGIWSDGSGTMGMVARSGSQAPGAPEGVNFAGFGFARPALNDAGQTAFFATLTGGGATSDNDQGIWSEGAGGLRMVARSGSQAAGVGDGVNFLSFTAPVALNNGGQTAFSATLTGGGDVAPTGIWSEGGGSLALVARTGQAASGADAGLTFSEFSLPALNDRGQSAFSALLAGGPQGTTNRGVWATDFTGALQLIVRTGALLQVAPGDSRTVSELGFNSESGFNNRGQIAFSATFTDGSQGVFVSNLVAVPEPTSLALGALTVLGGIAMRRPRFVARRGTMIKVAKFVAILMAVARGTTPACALMFDSFGSGVNKFDVYFVNIGNPNNPADTTGSPNPAGSVAYPYRMGMFEVSRDMIAKANALGGLGIPLGDLSLSGGNGPNKPASGLNWFEAATFANWLNTSTGRSPAYKFVEGVFGLWQPGDAGYDPLNPYRNSRAKYFLPSIDEWYKAAYYDPSAGVYYDYATGSNSPPVPFPGGIFPYTAVYLQPFEYGPADITSAGALSPYGTMAQNGNVYEWQETGAAATTRGNRGGSWFDRSTNANNLRSSITDSFPAAARINILGFRVASVAIPEPSALALLAATATFWRRRGRLDPKRLSKLQVKLRR